MRSRNYSNPLHPGIASAEGGGGGGMGGLGATLKRWCGLAFQPRVAAAERIAGPLEKLNNKINHRGTCRQPEPHCERTSFPAAAGRASTQPGRHD